TPFPRTMFAGLPNLKLLITSGMRNAAIDMEAAKDYKVTLCGTQWGRDPTAPLTMGLILELTRNIGRENARMHAGEPLQKFVGMEIEGRTLGVIGLGKLGTKVSRLAQAFGMNGIAWSPKLDNMVLTPHLGYVTGDSFQNHYRQMVEGIDAWF